jgi:protein-L-isoaspartate O-methyltransferase
MTSSTSDTVDHPFFARIWPAIAAHETEQMRELRRENLAGLSGRVLEVGAGTGTNFGLYPDSVAQVVAVEPEQRLVGLAREAAAGVVFAVEVTNRTVESFSADEPFDAVVCSLVLCSVWRWVWQLPANRGHIVASTSCWNRPRIPPLATCSR